MQKLEPTRRQCFPNGETLFVYLQISSVNRNLPIKLYCFILYKQWFINLIYSNDRLKFLSFLLAPHSDRRPALSQTFKL